MLVSGKFDFVFGLNEFDFLLVPLLIDDNICIYMLKNDIESFEVRNYETIDNLTASEIDFNSFALKDSDLIIKVNKKEFFEKFDYIIDYATLSMCSQALGIIEKMQI